MVLVCAFTEAASAQFINYNTAEGLPQSWVFSFHKDPKGRMWMATGDGIVRFDGRSFSVVPCINNQGLSIKRFSGDFKEDNQKRIWIGGLHGIFCYDPLKGAFIDRTAITNSLKLTGDVKMVATFKDQVWFYDESNTLFRYHVNSKFLKKYPIRQQIGDKEGITSAEFVKGIGLLIASRTRIAVLDTVSGKLQFFPGKMEVSGHEIISFASGEVYITGKHLHQFDVQNGISKPLYPHMFDGSCRARYVLLTGDTLWVATSTKGLYVIKKSGKVLKNYRKEIHEDASLPVNDVVRIYQSDNLLWLGTDGGGISIMQTENQFIKKINTANSPALKQNSFIKSFFRDKTGRIWVGTHEAGLIIYSNDFTNSATASIPGKTVSLIFRDPGDNVWVGTDKGLFLVDEYTLAARRVILDPYIRIQEGSGIFYDATVSSAGNIYLATGHGLFWLNKKELKIHLISDSGSIVMSVKTHRNKIWMGMYNDFLWIRTLDESGDIPRILPRAALLNASRVRYIHKNAEKSMWLCTEQGLQEYDINGDFIRLIDEKSGLANSFIYGLIEDNNGNFWLSTNKGISRYNIKTGKIRNFGISDNLQDNEFNTGSFYHADNGLMYFGGISGFNIINPDKYVPAVIKSPLSLLKLRIGNHYYNADSIAEVGYLELNHEQNNLEVEFVLPEYLHQNDIVYYYRLDANAPWISIGNRNVLYLGNLSPGMYQLMVKAINADGYEAVASPLLKWNIKPHFTGRVWFRLLILLLGLMVISVILFMIYRYRLGLRLAELKKREELLQVKQRISRDLHDNLGAAISRLNLYVHKIKLGKSSGVGVEALSDLAIEMRHQVNEIVWSVNTDNDYLDNYLAYLRLYVSEIAEEAQLDCKCDFPQVPAEIIMLSVYRQNLMAIIKESLNNTIKYAKAKKVELKFIWNSDGWFTLTVCDDGIGFEPERIGQFSNGLKNMRSRARECGFIFNLTTIKGKGTSIEVSGDFQLTR